MNTPNITENYATPYRGPIAAIKVCLCKYFDFRGRASRSEYWWFFLFTVLVDYVLVRVSDCSVFVLCSYWFALLTWLISLTTMLPLFAVGVRRLHDRGYNGYWLLPVYALLAVSLALVHPISKGPFIDTGLGQTVVVFVALGFTFFGIWILVLMILKGKPEANQYGNPVGNAK